MGLPAGTDPSALRAWIADAGPDRPAVSVRVPAAGDRPSPRAFAALAGAVDRLSLPIAPSPGGESADLARVARETGVAVLLETPPFEASRGDAWRESVLDAVGHFVEAGVSRLLLGLALRDTPPAAAPVRFAASFLDRMGLDLPFVLIDPGTGDPVLDPSVRLGACLCDGFGDAVRIEGSESPSSSVELLYDILQASRLRSSRADFISCPSCGRTLFDLESTSRRIRELTGHLKGVKIAIMGCLVNGPGEMADADFGYVGWKPGKVNLYVGSKCVIEGVPEAEAGERLVELIKESGRWVDPPVGVGPVYGARSKGEA
jgi:(E)-4-hydroxy-3-methylbut-2-enyl-diphosphate synthase